jgi:hypothetical protein
MVRARSITFVDSLTALMDVSRRAGPRPTKQHLLVSTCILQGR